MANFPIVSARADERVGPSDTGYHILTATSTTTSAANLNLVIPAGEACYVTFQPVGGDVYLRFKPTATTAATTTSNGVLIVDKTMQDFWCSNIQSFVDHIASASCTLRWWKSSRAVNNS